MSRRMGTWWMLAFGILAGACSSDNAGQPNAADGGAADVAPETASAEGASADAAARLSSIQTVFVILFENHNWLGQIKGNPEAPYINGTLLSMGAHAEQYYNPPLIHPSEPNYVWMEAGDSLGIINDLGPEYNAVDTTDHLVNYLEHANISWKAYEEDIDSQTCPLGETATYAPKHNPFVFFKDVTGNNDPKSPRCLAHIRPYSELATDISKGTIARYNFITPNLCHDMHDCGVSAGDAWMMSNIPPIMATSAYTNGGAIFVTWDEGEDGDGPVGFIALSPKAKPGYMNSIHYDHGSLLKTLQEIFGVGPLLRHAADPATNDLSDLFSAP